MNDERNYQQREHLYRVCVCLVLLCVCVRTLFCYVLNNAENSRELNHGNRRRKKRTRASRKGLAFNELETFQQMLRLQEGGGGGGLLLLNRAKAELKYG